MKNTTFIFLFCFSLALQLHSQTQKLDSLFNVLKTTRHDTTRYNAYLAIGDFFQRSNPDTAIYYHNLAEKKAEKIPGAEGALIKGVAIRSKGWDYYVKSDYTKAMELYNVALSIAEKYEHSKEKIISYKAQKLKAASLGNFGVVYKDQSDYARALENYFKALKICEEIGNKQGQAINLGNIGVVYLEQGNYAKALEYYFKALKIYEEIGNKQGKANNLGNIGTVYSDQGDYAKALEYYFQALKINEEIGNKNGQAANIGNIGVVYHIQGNYAKALEYYFKALKINEEIGNKKEQAANLGNIGIVYVEQSNYAKALEYYFKALKINEEIGNKQGQAANLANIGLVYSDQGNYAKSLENYFKALKICDEIGDKRIQTINLGNIGIVYKDQGNYAKALEYYFKAQKIDEEIGDKRSQAINLGNIGSLYLDQKKFKEAEKYLKQAEQMNRELGTIYYLKDACQNLSELYTQTGKSEKALYYYKEHIKYRDSVMSEENQKAAIQKEMQYQYEKQRTADSIAAAKQAEIHKAQIAQQQAEIKAKRNQQYALYGGLALVMIFAGFMYNRYKITQRQKDIIAKQKKLVEEKNKEITDSILYAKRIQQAILPSQDKWQTLLPNSFVLYLPKDIIAGDFYWMEETKDYIFLAAADSTGHGVPGAMVSVVCSGALTKAVKEEGIIDTCKILDRAREIVIERLSSDEQHLRDGMDVCLVRINKRDKNKIQFSGANRSLLIITPEKEVIELKGDKQPIGWYEEAYAFSQHEVTLSQSSIMYLSTDGFSDQFGGAKGKKMGSKQLVEVLKNMQEHSIITQGEQLSQFFSNWKGNQFQVDDVTLIGVKV
ncbi:MAG: tetratricopeptide repeat protein [Bacteroidota bacterium]